MPHGFVALNALYLLSTVVCWLALKSIVPPRLEAPRLQGALALALGPPFLAWVTALMLRCLPGLSSGALWGGVTAILGICAVATLPGLQWGLKRSKPASRWVAIAAFTLLSFVVIVLVTLSLFVPIYENDALEYLTAGKIIAQNTSLDSYPMFDAAKSGGFYGPWTHPAGYPTLIALGHLYQDAEVAFPYARLACLYASIGLLLMMWRSSETLSGLLAAAVLTGTPIFGLACVNMWIDPVRVAAGTASVLLVGLLLRYPSPIRWRCLALLGFALGLTFFVHSIGLVMIALSAVVLVLLAPGSWGRRLASALFMGVVSLLVVSFDLVANLRNIGAPIADSPPVWGIPQLGFDAWVTMARGLSDFEGKLWNGILMGFSQPVYYGWSYTLAAIGVVTLVRGGVISRALSRSGSLGDRFRAGSQESQLGLIAAMALLFWYGCAVAATSLGVHEFIKNVRYLYTVQPFVALIAGLGLSRLFASGAGR